MNIMGIITYHKDLGWNQDSEKYQIIQCMIFNFTTFPTPLIHRHFCQFMQPATGIKLQRKKKSRMQ